MKAMVLESLAEVGTHHTPLRLLTVPKPTLNQGEILLRVTRCGVCHTELDEIEGRIKPHLPISLVHQVVGIIEDCSNDLSRNRAAEVNRTGRRVGVAWIVSACGRCPFCLSGNRKPMP